MTETFLTRDSWDASGIVPNRSVDFVVFILDKGPTVAAVFSLDSICGREKLKLDRGETGRRCHRGVEKLGCRCSSLARGEE